MNIGMLSNRHCGLYSIYFGVAAHYSQRTTCYNVGIREGSKMIAMYDTASQLFYDDVTGQIDSFEHPCLCRIVVEKIGFVPVDLQHFIDALDCSFDFDVEAFDDEGIEFGTYKKVHGRHVYPFEVNGYHFEFTQSDITKLKKHHKIVLCAMY